MKEKWFNYVITNKKLWCNGFTLTRLNKVKDLVLNDSAIDFDFKRHSADTKTPEELKQDSIETYNHFIGNFTCNILYMMMDNEIIKK